MRPPLHLVITDYLSYAHDRLSMAQEEGKIASRTSRLEAVTTDGTVIRIMSLDSEIRGLRPQSHQILLRGPTTHRIRNRLMEQAAYCRMGGSEAKEIL